MKRVVVAIDHSAVSRNLMDTAFGYAVREKDVILYFLNVVEPGKTGWRSRSGEVDEALIAKVRKEVHDWVHESAAQFGQAIPDLRIAVRSGVPSEMILEFAEGVAAELIMIGHRGTSNGSGSFWAAWQRRSWRTRTAASTCIGRGFWANRASL